MSSKYDKTVQISHEREEEGTYHRREIENCPTPKSSSSKPSYTTQSYQVVKVPSKSSASPRGDLMRGADSDHDNDNFEEWTTSKRKVNHKTRQVETRVSRQLLVEDGKVIADSGPQVVTRIKEDNKVEECEREKAPKNKGKFEALENAPEGEGGLGGRVLGEKKEIQRVSREVREENMQYHDERFKELTGHDVHRRAIQAPHELITITDRDSKAAPRGKMVHYSNKGKKYQDTDEILEVAKLAIDGSITKEVKRTKHHEEFSEDEKPDEKGEAEELRKAPKVTRSSRRHVDYVNDFDDTSTPSCSEDEQEEDRRAATRRRPLQAGSPSSARRHHSSGGRKQQQQQQHERDHEEAFPRYQIDPLLNSLRDEDYRPTGGDQQRSSRGHHLEVRRGTASSSASDQEDSDQGHRHRQRTPVRSQSPRQTAPMERVEVPEEYRVNRQRLLTGKSGAGSRSGQRERSFSPAARSHLSHSSSTGHNKNSKSASSSLARRRQKEDASVQAHLTDEEIERQSSLSGNSHERATKQLQRQSTRNSSRNYYFGEKGHSPAGRNKSPANRRPISRASFTSTSSASSLSDPKERLRKEGARSRDSGFRSPAKDKQQIYSVSRKSKEAKQQVHNRGGAVSPTPTNASLGQRSVKTTTTTMSAGLADRPASRAEQERRTKERESGGKSSAKSVKAANARRERRRRQRQPEEELEVELQEDLFGAGRRSLASVSLSSLVGPNATTIKVPYQQPLDGRQIAAMEEEERQESARRLAANQRGQVTKSAGVRTIKLHEDIESLRRRLADMKQEEDCNGQHFDHRAVVANVPNQQVVIGAYNMHKVEQNSPFKRRPNEREEEQLTVMDNNNEANFNLGDYSKLHRAVPAMTVDTNSCSMMDDASLMAEKVSLASTSSSLRSSRTYSIRRAPAADCESADGGQNQEAGADEDELNGAQHFPVIECASEARESLSQLDRSRRAAAWIFDPRDNSTTTIQAPPKPKEAEPARAKTEELAESRGGRSYYLELIENEQGRPRKRNNGLSNEQRRRPNSIDSLYSQRWSSQSALNANEQSPALDRRLRRRSPAIVSPAKGARRPQPAAPAKPNLAQSVKGNLNGLSSTQLEGSPTKTRQQALSNRSKSSSCLLAGPAVCRPSKYSIYGGLRRPNDDNKPVPRLSYSRAIGPKSQRQLDAQSKLPSRYLKMK